jgi:acyl-CoA hydrolase
VRVTVYAERRKAPHETVPVTAALVTMVAVDGEHRAVPLGGGGG